MLWVKDNFVDPELERELALKAQFQDFEYEGFRYPGIAPVIEDSSAIDRIAAIIGAPVLNSSIFYRYYGREMKQQGFIHSDANIAKFTAVVFLSEPKSNECGLALWKHKESKTCSFPDQKTLDKFGGWERFRDEGFDQSKWWMTHFVPMVPGRIVIFPGAQWHSRYPQPVDNSEVKDARLIKVFFCR